jgi:hypothetical protein
MLEKTNTLNNSTSILDSMGYAEFEEEELDRFFREFYTYDDACLMFDDLKPEKWRDLTESTKRGIRSGIEDYLQTQDERDTIYHADLYTLVRDNILRPSIEKELDAFGDVDDYADNVSKGYSLFLYNESRDKFMEIFKELPVE